MPTDPTLEILEMDIYLQEAASAWDDAEKLDAFKAEIKNMKRVLRFPIDPPSPAAPLPWPDDLMQSLKRRIHRNLVLKGLPLGYQMLVSETSMGAVNVSYLDGEIRRYEAPFKKRNFG